MGVPVIPLDLTLQTSSSIQRISDCGWALNFGHIKNEISEYLESRVCILCPPHLMGRNQSELHCVQITVFEPIRNCADFVEQILYIQNASLLHASRQYSIALIPSTLCSCHPSNRIRPLILLSTTGLSCSRQLFSLLCLGIAETAPSDIEKICYRHVTARPPVTEFFMKLVSPHLLSSSESSTPHAPGDTQVRVWHRVDATNVIVYCILQQ